MLLAAGPERKFFNFCVLLSTLLTHHLFPSYPTSTQQQQLRYLRLLWLWLVAAAALAGAVSAAAHGLLLLGARWMAADTGSAIFSATTDPDGGGCRWAAGLFEAATSTYKLR